MSEASDRSNLASREPSPSPQASQEPKKRKGRRSRPSRRKGDKDKAPQPRNKKNKDTKSLSDGDHPTSSPHEYANEQDDDSEDDDTSSSGKVPRIPPPPHLLHLTYEEREEEARIRHDQLCREQARRLHREDERRDRRLAQSEQTGRVRREGRPRISYPDDDEQAQDRDRRSAWQRWGDVLGFSHGPGISFGGWGAGRRARREGRMHEGRMRERSLSKE